jgi:glycine C-acetyltransferase
MFDPMREHLARLLEEIRAAGPSKDERLIASPQGARIVLQDGRTVLNLCANNYLGLSGHPELIAAAQAALARWGYGLSSVRFICGTQTLHKELERRVADFLGVDDADIDFALEKFARVGGELRVI